MRFTPLRGQRLHLYLTIAWFLMMPLAIYMGWVASVVFIAVASIYANFVGHFSSWQASRVEVRQENLEDERVERENP